MDDGMKAGASWMWKSSLSVSISRWQQSHRRIIGALPGLLIEARRMAGGCGVGGFEFGDFPSKAVAQFHRVIHLVRDPGCAADVVVAHIAVDQSGVHDCGYYSEELEITIDIIQMNWMRNESSRSVLLK